MSLRLAHLVLLSGLALLLACDGGQGNGHDHDHDHDHEHGDHDHDHDHEHGEEGHVHTANFGGQLVPLGTEFANVEIKLDPETGTLDAWVWDGCAEDPIRLSQESLVVSLSQGEESMEVSLGAVADQFTGEEVGDTCHFAGQNDALKGLHRLEGTLRSIEVKGESFESVAFEYLDDDHD